MNCFEQARRIVVKVGSSTLTHSSGLLHIRRLEKLVKVLADLKNSGREIVLVSSGAIAVGMGKLGLCARPADIPSKQALAAVGQCELMYRYDKLFSEYNHTVAQVLLTRDVVEDPQRKEHCVNALGRLLQMNVLPIVNENDTTSVEEIEFGDNDTLSALVAVLCGAQALVILSDIDGLYSADPRVDPGARLIRRVERIDGSIELVAGGAGTSRGTGGMLTKIQAARYACANGVDLALLNGRDPQILYRLLEEGEPAGTHFCRYEEI